MNNNIIDTPTGNGGGTDSPPTSETGQVRNPETGQVLIHQKRVCDLKPSPENDALYRPIDPSDPDIIAFAERVRIDGILEPLVITVDDYILSGHRRRMAAELAGLETVPCRIEPLHRAVNRDEFLKRLREYNRQREKSNDEKLREAIVDCDTDQEYAALIQHRAEKAKITAPAMVISGTKKRAEITKAKLPMMLAVEHVLKDRRKFWPLTDRQIHYAILNNPPLKHASKPDSVYRNDPQSYKNLTDLLTRARLVGRIPMDAIIDETRPCSIWDAFRTISGFVEREINAFLRGYARDLMQSQPNHVEIVGEKNTLLGALRPIAGRYCIPLTIGRGYSSLPPRNNMADRFRKSGKETLVIVLLSDYDPDGDEISLSFARSMRDDFGIKKIHPVRAALTNEQVERFALPPMMTAKKSSVHYEKFTEENGENVFELEALHPAQLQEIVTDTINGVIDIEAFNREVDAEKVDSARLAAFRTLAKEALGKVA